MVNKEKEGYGELDETAGTENVINFNTDNLNLVSISQIVVDYN